MTYLTQATPSGSSLTLRQAYQASAVLTGQALRLELATIASGVSLQMSRVFVGAKGPMPPAVVLIDPARPIAYAATAKTIYRMDYSAGQLAFAVCATANLAQDWANRQLLAYT